MIDLWSTYCDEGYYCAVYSKCCARGCCIFSRNGVSFHQAGVGIIFIVIFVVILACLCVSARPVPLTPWFTHRSTPYPSTQSITQSFLNLFVRPPPYSEVVARDDVEAPPPYSEVCENPDRYPVIVALPPNNNIGSKIRRGLSKSCSIGRLKNQNRFFSNAYNTNEILYPYFNTDQSDVVVQTHKPTTKMFNTFRTKSCSLLAKLDSNDNTISELLLPCEMGHQPYKIKASKSFN